VETLAASEECDIDGVPHIKATDALNLDVDLPTGTEAAGMTQVTVIKALPPCMTQAV
jgi:hypothetical protein